jgi:hypothetical protein
MKECPFCREDIRDDAIKCRFCGSALLPDQTDSHKTIPKADLESNQVLLVIDHGFLYFAKFVGSYCAFRLCVCDCLFRLRHE